MEREKDRVSSVCSVISVCSVLSLNPELTAIAKDLTS
jgi:hypothetical protein